MPTSRAPYACGVNMLTMAVVPFGSYDPPVLQLVPVVDGVSLVDLVGTFEAERGFDVPGRYAGVIPTFFKYGSLTAYYGGQPETSYWQSVGKVALLGCDCGEVGCWPFYARVSADATVVRWSEFEQPHRPSRDYGTFGSFAFNRSQYDEAVARAVQALDAGAS